MKERNPIADAIREAIYPFNSRIEVITSLIEVLQAEQRAYHKTMEKQITIENLVAGLRMSQFTSKAAKRKNNRPQSKSRKGRPA